MSGSKSFVGKPSYRALLAVIKAEATATLEQLPEDLVIEGNAIDSGDPAEDRRTEQWIRDQLSSGNEWAWCTAHVTITWQGLTESDYLGACSYESEAAFRADGYFADMQSEACIRLAQRLHREWDLISAAMQRAPRTRK